MKSVQTRIQTACAGRHAAEMEALREHRAAGKKVAGYTCSAFPAAAIAGLGLWPVRVMCGVNAGMESQVEKILRPDVCPLVKNLLGNILECRQPHAGIDLWMGLFTCDQMRRGLNILSNDLGKEVYPVQLPATRTDETAKYYASQIERLVSTIEKRHGCSFNAGLAAEWQREYNEAGMALAAAARSGDISPLDLHAMFHLLFTARPFGLAEFFSEQIESSDKFESKKTVILSGSPLALEDAFLLEELHERKIAVLFLNCTGLNAIEYAGPQSNETTPGALAMQAFSLPACARVRPNKAVYDRIAAEMESTGASGLIVKCLKYCDQWYTERERIRKSFTKPVLVFDSDYGEGGRERLKNLIDAFLEMVG